MVMSIQIRGRSEKSFGHVCSRAVRRIGSRRSNFLLVLSPTQPIAYLLLHRLDPGIGPDEVAARPLGILLHPLLHRVFVQHLPELPLAPGSGLAQAFVALVEGQPDGPVLLDLALQGLPRNPPMGYLA